MMRIAIAEMTLGVMGLAYGITAGSPVHSFFGGIALGQGAYILVSGLRS